MHARWAEYHLCADGGGKDEKRQHGNNEPRGFKPPEEDDAHVGEDERRDVASRSKRSQPRMTTATTANPTSAMIQANRIKSGLVCQTEASSGANAIAGAAFTASSRKFDSGVSQVIWFSSV